MAAVLVDVVAVVVVEVALKVVVVVRMHGSGAQ